MDARVAKVIGSSDMLTPRMRTLWTWLSGRYCGRGHGGSSLAGFWSRRTTHLQHDHILGASILLELYRSDHILYDSFR